MAVIHFNQEGFQKALEQGSPLLVDFWADWCGPCNMLAPTVERLADRLDGRVAVGKVNVDDEGELARQYGVMSIPTLVLFKGGKEVGRTVGVQSQGALEKFVNDNI